MADLNDVSAAEAARRIRSGALSPSNLLAACLKRIDALEPTLKAWVHLDRDAAARVAVQRDIEAREGRFMGPLHGVPVALKDIYDAAGLVTTAGAEPWAHRRATVDAVHDELGLTLKPTKAPVNVLVIDHVEKPSPD